MTGMQVPQEATKREEELGSEAGEEALDDEAAGDCD